VALAQPQAVQLDLSNLRAELALEGTLELATVLSPEALALHVSIGHEGTSPLCRTWYLPGQRSGLLARGPKKRPRRQSDIKLFLATYLS
jgi:hypothetical protein